MEYALEMYSIYLEQRIKNCHQEMTEIWLVSMYFTPPSIIN